MSSVHNYPTTMKDRDCIIAAVKQLGYTPTVLAERESKMLRSYSGGTIGIKAEMFIPKEQINWASNDIGFVRRADNQFDVVASKYGELSELGPDFVVKLKQAYAEQTTMKLYRNHGYTQFERREVQTANGTEVVILAQTPQESIDQTVSLGY